MSTRQHQSQSLQMTPAPLAARAPRHARHGSLLRSTLGLPRGAARARQSPSAAQDLPSIGAVSEQSPEPHQDALRRQQRIAGSDQI